MPTGTPLLFERTDGITRRRFHRPALLNAIDVTTAQAYGAILEARAPRFSWA